MKFGNVKRAPPRIKAADSGGWGSRKRRCEEEEAQPRRRMEAEVEEVKAEEVEEEVQSEVKAEVKAEEVVIIVDENSGKEVVEVQTELDEAEEEGEETERKAEMEMKIEVEVPESG